MVKPQDVLVISNICCDDSYVKISEHTVNTWQPNRNTQEKLDNTKQGKIAETAVQQFLVQQNDFCYVPCDDIRTDNFTKHAPFDGLLYRNGYRFFRKDVEAVNRNIAQSTYGKISEQCRAFLHSHPVYTVEIKSTRITEKKKAKAAGDIIKLISSIQENHFLTYPYFLRYSQTVDSFTKYCDFVAQHRGLSQEQLLAVESLNIADIFVHVYTDGSTCFLMGFLPGNWFFKHPVIQRFFLKNKSEAALYYSYSLSQGFPIKDLIPCLKEVTPDE